MKLLFGGDLCVTGTSVPGLGDAARQLFLQSDLVCFNFEAPSCAPGEHRAAPKAGPSMAQSASAIDLLRACGTTHVSLANNHVMDYGRGGLTQTIERLGDICAFGAGVTFEDAYAPVFVHLNGMRVALLAFGEAQFGILREPAPRAAGYAWIDHPRARGAVVSARANADWVLVQVHAGLEMVDIPLPEWRDRYRELIDLGADIVIGHHPHVLQGMEFHCGKPIYYSLGNFWMEPMRGQADPGTGGLLEVDIGDRRLASKLHPLRSDASSIDLDDTPDAMDRFDSLCSALTETGGYSAKVQAVCDEFWRDVYAGYYESALYGLGTAGRVRGLGGLLRRLAGRLRSSAEDAVANELLLLHNIRIETHRWVVERVLSKRQ
jgi:hypothetical protein